MKNQLSILNIEECENPDTFKLICLVDDERKEYQIKFERLGISIPGKLEDLITQRLKRSRRFIETVSAFYRGEDIVFPVDLNNF
jgi:hypothetical protein